VKGKVNTAMSYGLPVVATPIAAEGMRLEDGINVLLADGASAFAETILRLYDDEELWNRLSTASAAHVWRHFSFDMAKATLQTALAHS
jgi:glycosyltransferase involved in cell wall biosynthesis